jgi:uncharacterized membrane protein YdjX (TVP38/TMEM64 family)
MTARLLAVAAAGEAATGLALMMSPSIVIRLLMGAELSDAGSALGRITGFALLSLGVACWPSSPPANRPSLALPAMLIYTFLATIYLLGLGPGGALVGSLLWPAVAIHAVFTLLLARAWWRRQR